MEEEEALGDFSSGVLGWGFAAAFLVVMFLLFSLGFLIVCVCVIVVVVVVVLGGVFGYSCQNLFSPQV